MSVPDLVPDLLPDIEHMAAFQAVCQLGDWLYEHSDNNFYVDYDDTFDIFFWTHKLYFLPITLALHSIQTLYWDLVDLVFEWLEEREQIMQVADKLKISCYLA